MTPPAAVELSEIPRRPRAARRMPTGTHRLNNRLAFWLLVLVTLSPVPLGSNRPAVWMVVAALTGVLGVWYFLALQQARADKRFTTRRLGLAAVLFLLVCAALAAQLLPLAAQLPIGLELAGGEPLDLPTISLAPGATWLMLLQLLGYGLFFLLVLQAAVNRERAMRMLEWLYFMVVVQAVFGLLMLTQFGDTILGFDKWAYEGAATGTFVNRNSYATFLAFGAAAGSALLVGSLTGGARRLLSLRFLSIAAGLFLIGLALFATQSRMGLAAAGAGTLIVLVLGALKQQVGWRTALALLVAAAVIAAAMLAPYGTGVLERVLELESAAGSRGELYAQVWDMILQRPWWGYGGGAFEVAFQLFHQPDLNVDLRWNMAHSTYLALWAELGLVAGTLPLLVVAIFTFRAVRAMVRSEESWVPSLAAIGVVTVAAMHSTVDFSLEIEANALLFLALLGMGVAADDRYGRA